MPKESILAVEDEEDILELPNCNLAIVRLIIHPGRHEVTINGNPLDLTLNRNKIC